MMTIDLDKDVGQRVSGTDNMSVKSVMGRHVLIQGFMELNLFGFICGLDKERHGDSWRLRDGVVVLRFRRDRCGRCRVLLHGLILW